jgi:hypothetical protein
MESAGIERRSAQGVTETACGIDSDDDGRQHVASAAVHALADRERRRTDDGDGVHDGAGMMAFNIAVVTEGAVHQGRRHAVAAQRGPENLRFRSAAGFAHKALEHGADVVLGRGGGQQRPDPVVDHIFGALKHGRGDLFVAEGFDEFGEPGSLVGESRSRAHRATSRPAAPAEIPRVHSHAW